MGLFRMALQLELCLWLDSPGYPESGCPIPGVRSLHCSRRSAAFTARLCAVAACCKLLHQQHSSESFAKARDAGTDDGDGDWHFCTGFPAIFPHSHWPPMLSSLSPVSLLPQLAAVAAVHVAAVAATASLAAAALL